MARHIQTIMLLLCCGYAASSDAASFLAPKLGYSIYSMNPEQDEKTPNYHGYFGQVSAGLSLLPSLDLGLLINYTPGSYAKAQIVGTDTSLLNYGACLNVRVENSLSLSLQALKSHYEHISEHSPDALKGRWQGYGLGVGLGMLFEVTRSDFMQLEITVQRSWLVADDAEANISKPNQRRLSAFSIGFAYFFGNFQSFFTEAKFFKGMI